MKGVSITYNADGKPTFLTIDLEDYDSAIKPLVEEILKLLAKKTDNADDGQATGID